MLFLSISTSRSPSWRRSARDRTNYFCARLLSFFKYLPHNGPTFCSTFYRYADDMGQGRNINRGHEKKRSHREKSGSQVFVSQYIRRMVIGQTHRTSTGWSWWWRWFRFLGDNYCAHYHNFTSDRVLEIIFDFRKRKPGQVWTELKSSKCDTCFLVLRLFCSRLRSNGSAGRDYCAANLGENQYLHKIICNSLKLSFICSRAICKENKNIASSFQGSFPTTPHF